MSDRHFLTALRSYLEQLATAPQPPDHEPTISSAWAQALFVRTLERVALGESKRTKDILADLDGYLQDWLGKDQGVRFIQRWDELLRGSFAHSTPLSERQRLLEVGLCRWFGISEQLQTEVRTRAVDELGEQAALAIYGVNRRSPEDRARQLERVRLQQNVCEYAVAVGAIRSTAHGIVLTPIGQVFLDLQGRDAVRWLLRLEVHQSTGPRDPLLLDRDFFAGLLHKPHRPRYWSADYETSESDDGPQMERSWPRLEDLGLISTTWDGGTDQLASIHLTSMGTELLTELLQPEDPLALRASALCADQLGAAEGKADGRDRASSMLAAEANARQACAVAHEIPNTLLPVQTQLGLLPKDEQGSLGAEALTKRRRTSPANGKREATIQDLWQSVQTEKNAQKKGRLLEELMLILLKSIPGFKRTTTNQRSADEELDLVVQLDGADPFWSTDGQYVLVECKNRSAKAEPSDITLFRTKMKNRHARCRLGFFVAMAGFTRGVESNLLANREGDPIVVLLQKAELQQLVDAGSGKKRNEVLRELHHKAFVKG